MKRPSVERLWLLRPGGGLPYHLEAMSENAATRDCAIDIQNVGYTYPGADHPALEEVHLRIEQGSFFGLLGPNGAGKTTLISLLTGILSLQTGTVRVQGQSLSSHAQAIKKQTGLVPQDYAFYPELTGRENLLFFAALHGLRGSALRARAQHCATLCRIDDVLDQGARRYSGGIKRRLNLAIGLLNKPHVLYLDEPTVGIDARSRRLILDAVQQLKAGGYTIIYTSHYMEEVEQLCDTVAVLDHGRVIVQDRISALVSQDEAEGVLVELLGPLPEGALNDPSLSGFTLNERTLYGQIPEDRLPALLLNLHQSGVGIRRATYGSSPLEQVYLRLIQREGAS